MKTKHLLVLIALCGLASASTGICLNTAGLFYRPIAADLGVSVGSVSLTMTIMTVISSFSGLLLPKILNEKSLWWIVLVSCIMMASGTFLMSLADGTALLYVGSGLRGIGSGLTSFILVTSIINNWYYKSHGLITSIALAFSGIPGVLLSPLITSLIQSSGWRFAMAVVAAIIGAVCLPALLFRVTIRPQTQSLLPYGYEEFMAEKEKGNIRRIDAGQEDFSFRTPEFALAAVFIVAVQMAACLPGFFPSFAESVGFVSVSGIILSLALTGNIVSKILFGMIVDRMNGRFAVILFAFISMAALVPLMLHGLPGIVLAAAFVYNFTAANSSVGITVFTSDVFGERNYSTVYPVLSFIGAYAAALSNALIGFLYDKTGAFTVVFWILIVVQAAVASTTFMAYRLRNSHTLNTERK